MDKKGYQINFNDGICTIRTPKPNRCTIGLIPQTNGLYRVSIAPQGTTNSPEGALATLKMVKEKTITGINLDLESKPNFCPQCVEAKATNRPFPKLSISNRAKAYGDKVISDLCGPSPTASEQRVYFLSKKSEAFEIYKIEGENSWAQLLRHTSKRLEPFVT